MRFRRLFPAVLIAAAAFIMGPGAVLAAPASSLLQAAPSVSTLETPSTAPGIEKAYYYRHYYHHYYHHRYRHYYHSYYRHYYRPYYRHYYYHPRYYHPYYHHYWHPFYF